MSSSIFKKPLPYLALLFANIIWGISIVVSKISLKEFPVMSLGFLRFSLAAMLMTPFLLSLPKKPKIKIEHLPKLLGVGLAMVTFNIFFLYEGLNRTTAINASALSMLVPIISVLCGWIFLREKVFWINLVGIFLGLIGAIIIGGIPLLFFGNADPEMILGNLLIILSAIATVIGSILSKDLLRTYSTTIITAVVFVVGAISFAIPAFADLNAQSIWLSKVTFVGVLGLLYLAILSSVSAYFLFEWALNKVEVTQANLFMYLQPAFTATLAVPLLGERISYSFIVGTVLVVLGVYWGTLGKPQHHHPHHRHHRV